MVTEKLHGANLGIYCNGQDIELASRLNMLVDTEAGRLYDAANVVERYKESFLKYSEYVLSALLSVFKLNSKAEGLKREDLSLIFYGELFGGSIQKNMPYSKEQDIALFDMVLVIDKKHKEFLDTMYEGDKTYTYNTDYDVCLLLCCNKTMLFQHFAEYGLPHVKVLHVGDFDSCLEMSSEFKSNYIDTEAVQSKLLNEKDTETVCLAEGLVIEPICSAWVGQKRAYLKNRSERFEKKSREVNPNKRLVFLDSLSAKATFVIKSMVDDINSDMFDSAVSKIGEPTIMDLHKIQGLMFQDLQERFIDKELTNVDNPEAKMSLKDYLGSEYKVVVRTVQIELANYMKPYLLGKTTSVGWTV